MTHSIALEQSMCIVYSTAERMYDIRDTQVVRELN